MLSPSIVTYNASEIIPAGARVKFVSGSATSVQLADAAEVEIGTAILYSGKDSYAVGEGVGVALVNNPGTRTVLLGGTTALTDVLHRDVDGKVSPGGAGDVFCLPLEAGVAGDKIEALWHPGLAVTVADSAVTAAKLADAVADKIPTVSVGVVDTGVSHTATVTIQLKDAQGNNLAVRGLIRVFFSATSFGAPTDLGTVTATTGQVLKADTTDALLTCNTDASGTLVLSHVLGSAGNLYAHASAGGLFVVANAAVA